MVKSAEPAANKVQSNKKPKSKATHDQNDKSSLISKTKQKKKSEMNKNSKQKNNKSSSSTKVRVKPQATQESREEELIALRKLGFKEGQKYVCSPVGDATRAFYESLLSERPNSVLAIKYCIEHGVLIGTQLKEQLARYNELKKKDHFKGRVGGIRKQLRAFIASENSLPIPSIKD